MENQSNSLRRALKRLGYTNRSLADALSASRVDGQSTSAATVSRWVSGASAVEPALVMFLKERLIVEELTAPVRRLQKPVQIAVGGAKGGSGASTLTEALAVTVLNLGYRVAVRQYLEDWSIGRFNDRDFYSPISLIAADNEQVDLNAYDFVFTVVPSRRFSKRFNSADAVAKEFGGQDFLLVPVDLSMLFGAQVALDVFPLLDEVPECPPWGAVQISDYLNLPYFIRVLERIKPWLPLLLPQPIIHRGDAPITDFEFLSPGTEMMHLSLFREICQRINVDLQVPARNPNNLRAMTLEELLDCVGA